MSLLTRRVVEGHAKVVRAERKALAVRVAKPDPLNIGDQGAAVKALQEHLHAAGIYNGKLTGKFDARTDSAVKALQGQSGLAVTGVVDRATLAKVDHVDLFVKAGFRNPARVGQRGEDIAGAERSLAKLKFKPGKVDGIFSQATQAAVKRFQHRHHLTANGQINYPTGVAIDKAVKSQPDSQFANKVIAEARKHLGFHERGNNGNPFSAYFHRGPEAWCADFVSYVYTKAGKKLNQSYTPTLLQMLHNNGTYTRNNPKPGNIIMFDWAPGSGPTAMHTGIVEKVFMRNGRKYVQTIEGNASDMVRRNVWPVSSSVVAGFGTVR